MERFDILLNQEYPGQFTCLGEAICAALKGDLTFTTSLAEAQSSLQQKRWHLLITAVGTASNSPGRQLLQSVRTQPAYDHMPLLVVGAASEDEESSLALGADDFVASDESHILVIARIKAQLRHKLNLDTLTKTAVDRDLFAAGVLHDIRNIESVIRVVCDYATAKISKDPVGNQVAVEKSLEDLIQQASRLATYAEDVIQTVRMAEKQVNVKPVALPPLFDWVIHLLGGPDHTHLRWQAATPLVPLLADEHFLQLALFNVIQNAVKYRRENHDPVITVSQRLAPDSLGQKPYIITAIQDNGCGVASGELQRIFEPFRRGQERRHSAESFGLGLSLVNNVVTKMKGRVWAELPANETGLVICIALPHAEGFGNLVALLRERTAE